MDQFSPLQPNTVKLAVHGRMPVILNRAYYDVWLDPGMKDVAVVSQFLQSFDALLMRAYAVSNPINHMQNDDAECAKPVKPQGVTNNPVRLLASGSATAPQKTPCLH